MIYPDTPKTLISRIYSPQKGMHNNLAWTSFFNLYHEAIQASIYKSLAKNGWLKVNEQVMEDIISDVLVSLLKTQVDYDRSKNFRGFLKQTIDWRVTDYIRKQNTAINRNTQSYDVNISDESETKSVEMIKSEDPNALEILEEKEEEERKAHQRSLMATMIEDLRTRVAPKTFQIFERSKLHHENIEKIMKDLNVTRGVVDNANYKCLNKLKELARQDDYKKEFQV
jgi:RNA polymerase sigma factor (sigma-70 family)